MKLQNKMLKIAGVGVFLGVFVLGGNFLSKKVTHYSLKEMGIYLYETARMKTNSFSNSNLVSQTFAPQKFTSQKPQDNFVGGLIPDILVRKSPKMNQIFLDDIKEFDVPLIKTKDYPEGEPAIQVNWAGIGRSQISPREKLFKIGFTSVSYGSMDASEADRTGSKRDFVSKLPVYQRFIWRGANEWTDNGRLHINGGDNNLDLYTGQPSYQAYAKSYLNFFKYAFNQKDKNEKLDLFCYYLDFENDMPQYQTQDFINRNFALHYYLKENLSPRSYFCVMYNNSPHKWANREKYNQPTSNPLFGNPVMMTENAKLKKMPFEFVGKKLTDLGDKMLVFTETYYWYEQLLPQDFEVKTTRGETIRINHFGTKNESVGHWAAKVGMNCELQRPWIGKRKLLNEMSIFNLTGNGYHYSNGMWADNRWIANQKEGFVEEVPPQICEGQVLLSLFSGAWVNLFNSDVNPSNFFPTNGAKSSQVKDYSGVQFYSKAVRRFVAEKAENASSIIEMIDGTENYLCENTEVDYLDGKGFRKIRASEWEDSMLSPVRIIVNEKRNEIAIFACRAYLNSKEPTKFKVRYQSNTMNFESKVLEIREGVNELWKFKKG